MLSLIVATSAHAWDHSWSTTGAMTFADFNSNTLLTDAQATDVVSKFRVISRKLISRAPGTASRPWNIANPLSFPSPSARARRSTLRVLSAVFNLSI